MVTLRTKKSFDQKTISIKNNSQNCKNPYFRCQYKKNSLLYCVCGVRGTVAADISIFQAFFSFFVAELFSIFFALIVKLRRKFVTVFASDSYI